MLDGHPFVLGGSLGVACYPDHGVNADALLQNADIAMYAAKTGGLGYAVYTPDRDSHAHKRLDLITELRLGIERDQFVFDYQPIIHLSTGTVLCVEALARWDHPKRGRLLPNEFVEVAEQTGLIDPLTELLLDKALAEWSGPNSLPVRVAVNLSPRNLRDAELPDRIAGALKLHRVLPSALVLEITENVVMSDPARATACLSRLHEMGITIAIDDFGSGYSSLAYLRRLPVDQLKIDQSFVMGLATGDDAIVRSTIDLAHSLGLTVVAEGVESAAVHDRLRQLNCDAVQGNFIAEPGSLARIRPWVIELNGGGPVVPRSGQVNPRSAFDSRTEMSSSSSSLQH
jgi:EAL domain-containing protein (putative c-di-GMP-specific phosphodiesterase class I)